VKKAKAPLAGSQLTHSTAQYFHGDVSTFTVGSDKHVPSRVSTMDESEIVPRGELSCTNSNPVLPDDYRLLQQPVVDALIKRCRAEGDMRFGTSWSRYEFWNLINIK
ncbi:Hypothetical predicted protein, partial [Scomber scombrus]